MAKKEKKILVLGAGALGSQLLASLLPDLQGKAEVTVLDFDKVEQRNIRAGTQLFFPEQVGMEKTEALQYNLYKLFNRKVNIITEKLTSKNTELLKGFDLLIDAFDNRQARRIVQKFAIKNKVACLHCGFSEKLTFAATWAENYSVPDDITSGFDVCEAEGAASFIRLAAAASASATLVYIQEGEKKEFVGNRFSVREVK